MTERLLRRPEVEVRTGLNTSTIYSMMSCGAFPRPVKILGTRNVAWPESTITAWIQSMAAEA